MLKAFGHPDVRILDGGLQKWKAAGYPVLSSTPVRSDDFEYNYNPISVRNFDEVKAITENGSAQIIDNRPAGAFASGNIPTSVNVPTPDLLNEDGTLKHADELKALYEKAGVDLSKPMVFTCGGGVMATTGRNAAEKAGATGERAVYDGAWAEYSVRSKE